MINNNNDNNDNKRLEVPRGAELAGPSEARAHAYVVSVICLLCLFVSLYLFIVSLVFVSLCYVINLEARAHVAALRARVERLRTSSGPGFRSRERQLIICLSSLSLSLSLSLVLSLLLLLLLSH